MSDALYHKAILDLARAATGAGQLDQADGRATIHNPLCGDRVTVEVAVSSGQITALAHKVRGCVLCEAAAAAIGAHAVGETASALRQAATALDAMLEHGAPAPAIWHGALAAFQPVTAVKSRHDCVLLPFQALVEALGKAGT